MQVSDTGNAKVDAMGDVVNNALAPFFEAPAPDKGVLGVVEQGIGAVMGLQNAPLELLNTGFAMLTAPIAAMMPAFPAAYLTVLHVGTPHAHAHPPSLIPPAPPVPLPSIGNLMLPGCVSVLIGGMPAGRAGDLGLAVTCGSFAPAFDVFLGSSNTFIGGNRAARMTDMTRHCNPASKTLLVSRGAAKMAAAMGAVGVGAAAVAGQALSAAIQAAQIAADAAAAALSALLGTDPGVPPAMGALMLGNPTVLIGGFPCPNFPNPLDGIMAGLKKLGKAIAQSKGLGKLLKKVGLCNQPGEPVNAFTGEVYNDIEDYRATDTGFVWERHYRSGWNRQDGPLGLGFRHFFQRKLTLLRKRAVYETHDNEVVALEKLDGGEFGARDGFSLQSSDGRRYELTTDRDETLEFEAIPTTPPSARLIRYTTNRLDAYLYYEASGRLRAVTEYAPGGVVDTHFVYDPQGRIEQVLRGTRGQPPVPISRYKYHDGCLSEWCDAVGAASRFRYDAARRMVQATDRRGYNFHWHYDPNSGRCIKSYGDDGLWSIEARYEAGQSFFTEPDGGVWSYKFFPDGTISHLIDPNGGVLQYVKDENGRIDQQITPAGLVYTWLYDEKGKHTGRVSPFGSVVPPEDDDPNPPNPLRHRGPTTQAGWLWGSGHANEVAPLPKLPSVVSGQLAKPSDPVPVSVLDPAGGIVENRFPDGRTERFQRDPEGNVVARGDTRGNWWQKHIQSWNLLGAEKSPLGAITQYAYTHRQKRWLIVDANGNRTEYRRDQTQRVVEIVQNGKPYLRYKRGVQGAVLEERDGDDVLLVKHETNGVGLHTASTLASGERYTYAYDDLGNFIEASSSAHRVERKFEDRKLLADLRDGEGIEHRFDDAGIRNSTFLKRFAVEYENMPAGVNVATPDGGRHRFWRDAQGVFCRENANGTGEALVFDARDRLASRACWRATDGVPATNWVARYRYDAEGLLEEVLDSEFGPTRYEYDADCRLVTQQGPGQANFEYRYDLAGNLTFTPAHGRIERLQDNLLAFSHRERFEYDSRQRLSKRIRFDGTETRYTYNSLDQLVLVEFSDRPHVWKAAYDGLGRRIWREYAGKRTDFYWDRDRLAGEVGPDGAVRVYVYPNEWALVPFMWLDYQSVEADPSSGIARYLFCAPTGMPLRVEDQSGQVVWQTGPGEPYGRLQGASTEHAPTRLRFAGHFYDEHLDLFYNRFRDYDPGLARYLQPDPLGHAGGLNLYAYASNPAVAVDLRGLTIHRAPKHGEGGGEQGGDKPPPRDSDGPESGGKSGASRPGPKIRGVSDADIALAASPGNTKAHIKARKLVAKRFYKQHGKIYDPEIGGMRNPSAAEARSQLKGIDYSKPVALGPPPQAPDRLNQWQRPGGRQGQFYAEDGASPQSLGIHDQARDPTTGKLVDKQSTPFDMNQDDQPYMKSTAAPIKDTWSDPGHSHRAEGGGDQYYVPNTSSATPAPPPAGPAGAPSGGGGGSP
jgi:RHS repeat-associated protein